MNLPWEDIIKIIAAFIAGGLLGYEREYRDKPAGLRTLIMITVGSTLFSILSLVTESGSSDRIASNIVTGVGFVGAGVIFKEGINVHGITTAATIWIAAAVGMALGFGEYWLAVITLLLVFVALTLLSALETRMGTRIQTQIFQLSFHYNEYSVEQLETELSKMQLKFNRSSVTKNGDEISVAYKIVVPSDKAEKLLSFFVNTRAVRTFKS